MVARNCGEDTIASLIRKIARTGEVDGERGETKKKQFLDFD